MQTGFMAMVSKSVGLTLSGAMWVPFGIALPEYLPVVAVSGMMGGVARWIAERQGVLDGIGTVVTGLLVGVFLWPVGQPMTEGIVGQLSMEPIAAMMFGGFFTGLLGTTLIGAVLNIFKARSQRIAEASDETD